MFASLRSAALALRSHPVGAVGAAVFLAGTLLSAQAPGEPDAPAAPATSGERDGAVVYRVPVTGTVEMGLAPFIARSIREAEAEGAAAAGSRHRHPGGRVDAAQQITDAIADARSPSMRT
jgi:membrane-bound ClpP family serine protease